MLKIHVIQQLVSNLKLNHYSYFSTKRAAIIFSLLFPKIYIYLNYKLIYLL